MGWKPARYRLDVDWSRPQAGRRHTSSKKMPYRVLLTGWVAPRFTVTDAFHEDPEVGFEFLPLPSTPQAAPMVTRETSPTVHKRKSREPCTMVPGSRVSRCAAVSEF